MPFEVYTKLYDSIVWPVISYGAALWGTKEYSCINAVHNRAARFFIGVGKYASSAAVNGDVGWTPPIVRQWKSVVTHWFRLQSMNENRLNHKQFLVVENLKFKYKNWCTTVHNKLTKLEISLNINNNYRKSQTNTNH